MSGFSAILARHREIFPGVTAPPEPGKQAGTRPRSRRATTYTAGGVAGYGSDFDLLGGVLGQTKRRGAARELLGR